MYMNAPRSGRDSQDDMIDAGGTVGKKKTTLLEPRNRSS